MIRLHKKLLVVNFIGGLFYISCMLQWLWATLPYLPGITHFLDIIRPVAPSTAPITQPVASEPPSILLIIIATAVIVVILAITIYVLIKLPINIAKTGRTLTNYTTNSVVPVIAHHKKLTPKKRQRLTARVLFSVKLSLCTAPVALAAASINIDLSIAYGLLMLIAATLGIVSVVLLSVQITTARLFGLRRDQIW